MRDIYHDVTIYGSCESSLTTFCNSIRFSTHCNYVVVSQFEPINTDKYEHFTWVRQKENSISHNCSPTKSIIVGENSVRMLMDENVGDSHQSVEGSDIKEYAMAVKDKDIMSDFGDLSVNEKIVIDALIDYEGDVNLICAVKIKVAGIEAIEKVYDPRKLVEFQFYKRLNKRMFSLRNRIISFEVTKRRGYARLDIKPVLNKMYNHWEIYRAFGINVPLIIVQNILKRKVKTYHFVNESDVLLDPLSLSPRYKFKYSTIYFDLDETLIWKDKAIDEIVEFLHNQRRCGVSAKLITRHTYDVSDTLRKIGLSIDDFDEITVVKPNELKSLFIRNDSIFIDNEFPQRLDVRVNSCVPSLDLDQIDFIK